MIRYISKHGGQISSEDNMEFGPKQWVQIINPSEVEIEQVAAEANLDAGIIRDAKDLDEMPRFEVNENNAYLFSRYAYRAHNGHLKTAPVLFVVTKDSFVSVSPLHFDSLLEIIDTLPHLSTSSPKHLLLPALNHCLQSYETHLSAIGRQIRTARNSLRDEKFSNRHFVRFVEIEDILNDFLSELVPINNMLLHLVAGRKTIKFTEHDKDILEDLQLETSQLIDESKGYLKTIVNIREAYSNIMTNNLNRQIKILTTLTIVLTVPTIVGSFFGMNVIVPLANNSSAFFIIFVLTIATSLGILAFLKRKDWL